MRIKSYFAPSVQSAISIARKEFGDDVTLVTSHTAALESRHLGDYEVVFAVEEAPEPFLAAEAAKSEPKKGATQVIKAAPAAAAESAQTPAAVLEPTPPAAEEFGDFLQQAMATPLSTEENVPEKLERIETLLVEVGVDGPMVRSLMMMIARVAGASTAAASTRFEGAVVPPAAEPAAVESAVEPEVATPALPDLTPAELAFYLSVSVGA